MKRIWPVVVAVGLGDRRVVGVAVDDVLAADAALGEHRLGLVVEAVALPGLGREDADVFQQPHRGDAVDDHLPGLSAGGEDHELVAPARRNIGLGRGEEILLGEAAPIHDVLQVSADQAAPAAPSPRARVVKRCALLFMCPPPVPLNEISNRSLDPLKLAKGTGEKLDLC
jgi:hypothetical protein